MKQKLDKVIGIALILLMAAMVLNVTWQVVSRYVLQNPSSFTDELSRYMLIWLGILGSAYVAGQNQHLAIDILPNKLEGIKKERLLIFIAAVVLVFGLVVMIIGGANLVFITFMLGQKSAILQLPLAYVYAIIPISGLLVVVYQALQIQTLLTSKTS